MAVNGSIPASNPTINTLLNGESVPSSVAVDGNGNAFVADLNSNAIYEILAVNGSIPASNPTINTLASGSFAPGGMTVDGSGNVFVADTFNNAVKEILAVNGSIPASNPTIRTLSSGVKEPFGLTVDGRGNVYAADQGNNRIVELDLADAPSLSFPTPTAAGSLDLTDGAETVMVENSGNAPLTITQVSFPPDFPKAAGSPMTPLSLDPGSTLAVAAEFMPHKAGLVSETITLTDDTLNQASAQQQIAVTGKGLLAQTITFAPPARVVYGTAQIDLSKVARASSGLAVSFHVISGPATLHGADLAIRGAGAVVVRASQAGSSSYGAAPPVTKIITVIPATLNVTATNLSVPFGKAIPALKYTVSGFVNKDPSTVVSGRPLETTTAKEGSQFGHYPITITRGSLRAANYTFAFVDGKLTITALGTAAAPAFKPAAGTYKTSASVTITDVTPGAVIHFTIGVNTTPTDTSTRYTKPITIMKNQTIKAIAIAPGYHESPVASAAYTID